MSDVPEQQNPPLDMPNKVDQAVLEKFGLKTDDTRSFRLAPLLSPSGRTSFRGAFGTALLASSCLGLLSALLRGANFFWVVGFARLVLSSMPSAGSLTPTGPSVSYGLVRGGPRSYTLAALSPRMLSPSAFGTLTPTSVLLLAA